MTNLDVLFFYRYRPKSGDIVVELGAYTGDETIEIANIVAPDGLVLAVEPHPNVFATLVSSVKNLDNVQLVEGAISDKNGSVLLTDDGASHRNHVVYEGGGCRVDSYTLDFVTGPLPRIDLLKMNIEGSEVDALRGGEEALAKTRNVVVSCHDFTGMPTKANVWELLEEAGFEVTTHDDLTVCGLGEASMACVGDYLYGAK